MFGDVLATCVLPWDERYRLDEDAFTGHLRLIAAEMTKDVYLFGTAGEGYAVTDTQFREIAALFVRESRECGIRPMLGLVSTSLGTVIDRIEFALELGCERFQLSFPGWGSVAGAEYTALAERGVRTGLPREYLTARGRRFAELAEAFTHVHELLLDCVPAARMDGAFEKVIARAHGARLDLRLLPPYLGATEEQAGRFVTESAGITGLDA